MSNSGSYRYSFTTSHSQKRRKLVNGTAMDTEMETEDYEDRRPRKNPPDQYWRKKSIVSVPSPEVTLPLQIIGAQTPQDLTYAIISSDKALFSKQELLTIISKLNQMLCPKFPEPCPYIN